MVAVGFVTTWLLGAVSVVLAVVGGFLVGTMRDSRNLGLQTLSCVYVQVFRNIPLILQIVFLYAILIHFPRPRDAYSIAEIAFLSNRGIKLPGLNMPLWVVLGVVLAAVILALVLRRTQQTPRRSVAVWVVGTGVLCFAAVWLFKPEDLPLFSIPELKGLRFRGGITLTVELVAMILGIVLYGAAYIAEVVRGGLDQVPKGLVEAGRSLGLGDAVIWWSIKVPMALRSIIPPLGNQWIFIMKATTVGVAISFADLFFIVSTAITQSGQTLELIFILASGFLLVNFSMAQGVNWLNRRLALKGYGS